MKKFSERKGLTPVPEIIQIDSMNDALRISLWNTLDIMLWSTSAFAPSSLSKILWASYFKWPLDSRPSYSNELLEEIRSYFFDCDWYEVYDFIEFLVKHNPYLAKYFNRILEQELSGYRFVAGQLVDVSNAQELEMLEEALQDTKFVGVSSHLQRALELYSDREHPDHRNSIKESISAVESMARIVSEKPKATLGDALKVIEGNGHLHKALKDGFLKLYGYTSDEQGIRHAMQDEPNLTATDAKFFLLSCTSFVNYLKAKLPC